MLLSPEDFTDAITTLLRRQAETNVLGVYFSGGDNGGGADVTFTIFIDRESYIGGNRGEDQHTSIDLALHIPGRGGAIVMATGLVEGAGKFAEAMEEAIANMSAKITDAFALVGVLCGAGISR